MVVGQDRHLNPSVGSGSWVDRSRNFSLAELQARIDLRLAAAESLSHRTSAGNEVGGAEIEVAHADHVIAVEPFGVNHRARGDLERIPTD